MTDIRLADELDEPEILRLMALAHEEQHPYPISWAKVTSNVRLATAHERGIVGVIGERGKLKGAVLILIEQPWYSDAWILVEYINFVHPDHRRSTYAKELIEYSKTCARALRIDLTMGVYTNIRTDAKVRLYRRQMDYLGGFFRYQPPNRCYEAAIAAE